MTENLVEQKENADKLNVYQHSSRLIRFYNAVDGT